jgi:hypothetical protein
VVVLALVGGGVATYFLVGGDDSDGASSTTSAASAPAPESSAASTGDAQNEITQAVKRYVEAIGTGDTDAIGQVVCSREIDIARRNLGPPMSPGSGTGLDIAVADIQVSGDSATAKWGFNGQATLPIKLEKEPTWKVCFSAR